MKLSTHLKVARKLKACRALLDSARVDLVNELGTRARPTPPKPTPGPDGKRARPIRRPKLNAVELLEDLILAVHHYDLYAQLMKEHAGIPFVHHAWTHRDIGAATFAIGRAGQRVALDVVQPLDPNSPILMLSERADELTEEAEV